MKHSKTILPQAPVAPYRLHGIRHSRQIWASRRPQGDVQQASVQLGEEADPGSGLGRESALGRGWQHLDELGDSSGYRHDVCVGGEHLGG